MSYVTYEQKLQARKTDLYDYLLHNHLDKVIREGASIRPRNNKSISIKRGYCGYFDFANNEHGNSIDYLTRHMGYNFQQAVIALCGGVPVSLNDKKIEVKERDFIVPKPIQGPYRQLYAYLMARGIDSSIISDLVHKKILYQQKEHNNMVFISASKEFVEIRGTLTGNTFRKTIKKYPDRFWWYMPNPENKIKRTAYICEAAIDAISLYQLLSEDAVYISIAGVYNQQAIDRIKGMVSNLKIPIINVILAVDNDKAGQERREKNSDINAIIPIHKDWNEDLTASS